MENNNWKEQDRFESAIAYFYGVAEEKPIKSAYIHALKKIEEIGLDSIGLLESKVIPYLEEAYQSIAQQRGWTFDIKSAAQIELRIIIGNLNGSSFEEIRDLMVQLYRMIFSSHSFLIQKAALLRTFLYQYKSHSLKSEKHLCAEDQKILLELAQASTKMLSLIDVESSKM